MLFDTLGNVKFVPFCRRRLNEIKVDISGLDSYITQLDKIKKELLAYSTDDAFKIILVGQVDPALRIDVVALSARLDHVFYAKVVDKTTPKFDVKKLENEKSLRGEFFRVVNLLDASDEQKQQILKLGFCALEGREVNDDQD